MSLITRKKIFHINSGSQLTSSNNIFSTDIQLADGILYDRVVLLSANIPVSYYVIQAGKNIFSLTENNNSVNITVPPGNYNISSFCYVVENLLTVNSPNGYTYTMTYPQNFKEVSTGKINYNCTAPASGNTIKFTFPPASPIYEQFGFNQGSTDAFRDNGDKTYYLQSSNVVSFVPENSVFIHSTLVSGSDTPSPMFSSCLQEIYNSNNTTFGILSWQNPSPVETSRSFIGASTNVCSFSLTDENALPIYLNGLDCVITVMVFKLSDTFARINKLIDNFSTYKVDEILTHIITLLEGINENIKPKPPTIEQPTIEQPTIEQPTIEPQKPQEPDVFIPNQTNENEKDENLFLSK